MSSFQTKVKRSVCEKSALNPYICRTQQRNTSMSSKKNSRTLHAYKVENRKESKVKIDLQYLLGQSVQTLSTLEQRMMSLTSDDSGESDLLTSWKSENNAFKGVIRPILPKELVSDLPSSFLEKERITSEELLQEASKNEGFTTLPPCYFAVSEDHVVILHNNKYSGKRFEAYINWLSQSLRKDYWISLLPEIVLPDEQVLSSTSEIVIAEEHSSTSIGIVDSPYSIKRVAKEASHSILEIIGGMDGFKDLDFNLEDVMSLQFIFKIKRNKLNKEDAEQQISRIARLFSSEEDITLKTKSGNVSVNKTLHRKKPVDIEKTNQNLINEAMLFAEMEKFLIELKR